MAAIILPEREIIKDIEFSVFQGLKDLPEDTVELLSTAFRAHDELPDNVELVQAPFTWNGIRIDLSAMAVVDSYSLDEETIIPFGDAILQIKMTQEGLKVIQAPIALMARTFPKSFEEVEQLENCSLFLPSKVKSLTLDITPNNIATSFIRQHTKLRKMGYEQNLTINPGPGIDVVYPMDPAFLRAIRAKLVDRDEDNDRDNDDGPIDFGPVVSPEKELMPV